MTPTPCTNATVTQKLILMREAENMADLLLELRAYFADKADYDMEGDGYLANTEGAHLADIDLLLERIGRRPS